MQTKAKPLDTNTKKIKANKPKLPPPFVIKATESVINLLNKLQIKMQPPSIAVLNMICGYWVTQFIYVAAKLNIADHLKKRPMTCQELAQATGANEQALYRLMRGLASLGIFTETKEGRFKLNALGKSLCADTPGSMRSMALMNGMPFHWKVWENFLETIKTGQPGFERTFGMDSFSFFNTHPEEDAIFSGAMTAMSVQSVAPIVAAYDFGAAYKVADIGGGEGSLLAGILQANSDLKGVLFDRPSVVAQAQTTFEQLAERMEFVSGDIFEKIPSGSDIYILKNILHDFSDEKALLILKKCREALNNSARLLIIETIIPAGNAPFSGKLIDLEMLMMTPGGRERNETEYGQLLEAAGFKLNRIVPTIAPLSLIEALPA